MPGTGRSVYIAGAGIAGLTLALALAKFGANVVVLERHHKIEELGAGLQISPNARRVLNQLGLDRQIAARSFEPLGMDIYPFGAGRPLVTLPLGSAVTARYRAPYAVMHRADLAEALYRSCRRFANVEVVFGVREFDVLTQPNGVAVSVQEPERTRTGRAHAFVGADGVNSRTRTAVLRGAPAQYSGHVAWRTTLPLVALQGVVALDRTSLLLGPGFHAVAYPLPHRDRVNVVLITREKLANSATLPTSPSGVKAGRNRVLETILTAAEGAWRYWPIATVAASSWHAGNIGITGDAAHAMVPFQAQGAAMAIEDAAVLAPLLMTEPTAESAFARFHVMRRQRLRRVADLSRFNARVFHLGWPLSLARDAALALQGSPSHLRRLDWLYAFDAAPEVETAMPVGA